MSGLKNSSVSSTGSKKSISTTTSKSTSTKNKDAAVSTSNLQDQNACTTPSENDIDPEKAAQLKKE